jgi:DNA-binding NarL/FixJ family response regulator
VVTGVTEFVSGGVEPIRVLIADDQRVVREGLAMLLGLLPDVEIVGTVADGEQAVAAAVALAPDIVLMDLRMPRCDGIEATRRLREVAGGVQVIALTTYADDRSVIDALQAGARGYLTKDAGADDIEHALREVVGGRAAIDPAVQHHLVDAITTSRVPVPPSVSTSPASGSLGSVSPVPAQSTPGGLTPRELDVLVLIAEGLSNHEIAQRLVVAEATVKSHINRILSKIDARDRAQAVSYAFRHGITSL